VRKEQQGWKSAGNSPDNTVGSLAELLGNGVALIDHKVLVEDLEYFASLEIRHGCALGELRKLALDFSRRVWGEEGFMFVLSRCGLELSGGLYSAVASEGPRAEQRVKKARQRLKLRLDGCRTSTSDHGADKERISVREEREKN
jgi:hypothetical protein